MFWIRLTSYHDDFTDKCYFPKVLKMEDLEERGSKEESAFKKNEVQENVIETKIVHGKIEQENAIERTNEKETILIEKSRRGKSWTKDHCTNRS